MKMKERKIEIKLCFPYYYYHIVLEMISTLMIVAMVIGHMERGFVTF